MYSFVKISTYYRHFLDSFFSSRYNPERSYEDSLGDLMAERFAWSDYYCQSLRALGVDAHELVANAHFLQKKWGAEHGVEGTPEEILFHQLEYLKPEVVFLQDSIRFGGSWISELRARVPSVRLVIGWYCSPMSPNQEEALQGCDFVMCCSPQFIKKCAERNIRAHLLLHAFEPKILGEIIHNPSPIVDFIFIGSILPGTGNHTVRLEILKRLIASGTGIDFYGHVGGLHTVDLWKQRAAYISASILRSLGLERIARNVPLLNKSFWLNEFPRTLEGARSISRVVRPPIYGLKMFEALAHSRMAFNYHGEVSGDYAANLRMFEVTGVGSCLITDWKLNLHEIFDVDREIVTFRTADECVERVNWLRDHPGERAEIARRGQEKVLSSHTYAHRAEVLHNIILQYLK